ncbi:hypothetical protein D1816_02415 [Aquimarina sp. AD10]|uniref:hypothetical protein n=1 Tax=Aquimarina sp. AD10 TaxID=1714849 RepID=UPI000E52DA23|nr:hypothetical protein [Aquimarina sp. AD10]AXT59248.1 hypothetical protein D1816_02415 [Aquimarina sp. AD10]RKM91866.1 hypothetical protein D7033_21780 [Aquimarina sp. AD10]
MDIINYEIKLEKVISDAINSSYPHSWTEDLITNELLKSIGAFFNKHTFSDNLNRETKIKFSAYKLKGKAETEFGDIAFLTNIRFDNGLEFKGVANFEAKKRIKDSFDYQKQSRKDQYKTICENKPYSQILLYDYEPISQHVKPIYYLDEWRRMYRDDNNRQLITQCVCFPLYMVSDGKKVNRNHNRIAHTMSEQFCRRIFYGLDLHLEEDINKTIKDFDAKNHPKFVVDLQITHGNTSIMDDDMGRGQLQDLYERLK